MKTSLITQIFIPLNMSLSTILAEPKYNLRFSPLYEEHDEEDELTT